MLTYQVGIHASHQISMLALAGFSGAAGQLEPPLKSPFESLRGCISMGGHDLDVVPFSTVRLMSVVVVSLVCIRGHAVRISGMGFTSVSQTLLHPWARLAGFFKPLPTWPPAV